MNPFVALISTLISLLWWAIFIWFALSILIQLNIINRWHPFVNKVYVTLESVLTPLLRPIRRVIPAIGGVDLSPLVLILGLQFLRNAIVYYGAGM